MSQIISLMAEHSMILLIQVRLNISIYIFFLYLFQNFKLSGTSARTWVCILCGKVPSFLVVHRKRKVYFRRNLTQETERSWVWRAKDRDSAPRLNTTPFAPLGRVAPFPVLQRLPTLKATGLVHTGIGG